MVEGIEQRFFEKGAHGSAPAYSLSDFDKGLFRYVSLVFYTLLHLWDGIIQTCFTITMLLMITILKTCQLNQHFACFYTLVLLVLGLFCQGLSDIFFLQAWLKEVHHPISSRTGATTIFAWDK